MTMSTTAVDAPIFAPASKAPRSLWARLAMPFEALFTASRCMHEYDRLSRLSDARLEQMGHTRAGLCAHVCKDMF